MKAAKYLCANFADGAGSCEFMCLRLCVLACGYALTSADPPKKGFKGSEVTLCDL